jgi:hypothetical protein
MSTDDARPASNEGDTPTCKKCQSSEQVSDVAMYGVDPDVRYWKCDRCGYVWGTRDSDGLSTKHA